MSDSDTCILFSHTSLELHYDDSPYLLITTSHNIAGNHYYDSFIVGSWDHPLSFYFVFTFTMYGCQLYNLALKLTTS